LEVLLESDSSEDEEDSSDEEVELSSPEELELSLSDSSSDEEDEEGDETLDLAVIRFEGSVTEEPSLAILRRLEGGD
jgi:hypothetical protein